MRRPKGHFKCNHAEVFDSVPGFLKIGQRPVKGVEQVRKLLNIIGSGTEPPALLATRDPDETVTETEGDGVTAKFQTPTKDELDDATAPSTTEKMMPPPSPLE